MTFNKRTLANAIAIALMGMSGQALASICEGDRDECYSKTTVYGNVTIAEDSVDNWGPWEQFAQPAAGPQPVLAIIPPIPGGPNIFNEADDFVPEVNNEQSSCDAGQSCFYAVYRRYHYEYGGGEYYQDEDSNDQYGSAQPANFDSRLPVPQTTNTSEDLAGSYGVSTVTPNPNYPDVNSQEMSTGHWHENYNAGSGLGSAQYVHMSGSDDDESANRYSYVNYYMPHSVNQQMLFGYWDDSRYTNTDNCDGECDYYSSYSYDGGEGSFVGGTTTTLSDMAALNAGNVQAAYAGRTGNWGSSVAMNVDFGTATWSASVNGGSDGYTMSDTDSFGQTFVRGNVGFNASGTISGANIASTSVSANDATNISGSMYGSFFGSNAAGVGGIVDITKSRAGSANGNDNIKLRDSGSAGYENARYVDTFQAVKQVTESR